MQEEKEMKKKSLVENVKNKCHTADTEKELRNKPFLEPFMLLLNASQQISQEDDKINNHLNIHKLAEFADKYLFYFYQCTSNTPSQTFNKVDSIENPRTTYCFSKLQLDPTNNSFDIIKH